MSLLDSHTLLKLSTTNLSAGLEQEEVVLNLSDGKYYGLNEIGTFVWKLLQEPRSVEELVSHITENYEVDSEECKKDVIELIEKLIALNMVEVVGDSAQ